MMKRHKTEISMPPLRFKGCDGEWEEKRLGDVFGMALSTNTLSRSCLSDCGVVKNIHYGDVLIKLPSVTDVRTADLPFVADDKFKVGAKNLLRDGDIVMADTAEDETAGKVTEIVGIDDQKVVSGLHTIVLRPNDDFGAGFLGYCLNAKGFHNELLRIMQGVKVLSVNKSSLADCRFFSPSFPEQQKLGETFRSLDALIASRETALEKLQTLKKAMLEKMFPRANAKVPEVRFKGFEGEWKKKQLKDICERFDYGLNVAAREYDGKVKYIRITDIDNDSRLYGKADVVSPDCDVTLANDYRVNVNDILFARTGAGVGKTYLYREDDGLVYFAGFLIRAHVGDSCDSEFVFQNTLTHGYEYYVEIVSQRSGQPGMNAVECASFEFHVPSLPEQRKIGAYFRSLDALISARRDEIVKLKDLKKALLDRMFV